MQIFVIYVSLATLAFITLKMKTCITWFLLVPNVCFVFCFECDRALFPVMLCYVMLLMFYIVCMLSWCSYTLVFHNNTYVCLYPECCCYR